MFRRRSDEELWRLQRELIAAEEEEEYEEDFEDPDEDGYDEYEDFDDEEYDEEDDGPEEAFPACPRNVGRYRRGNPKKFRNKTFFDKKIYDHEDVLYRKDYKKAKRRKRRKALGLMILSILELIAIGALILWFMSWM